MNKIYSIGKIFALLLCMSVMAHQNANAQCNASGGSLTPTCNNQQVQGGGGEYWTLNTTSGVIYTISGFSSGCANNNEFTVNCTGQTGTYQATASGSSWDIGFNLVSGSTGANWCGSSSILYYRIATPVATGSGSATVCASTLSYPISGFSASTGTISWTSSGDGTFTNGTTVNPTYNFGTNDKANGGPKTLTMTVNNGGCTATATFSLTIDPVPTATPGSTTSFTVCSNAGSYTIPGGYQATNGTISWTSSGDGTFTNNTTTTPTYAFGSADIANGGSIILTMHVTGTGVCAPATTTFSLNIVKGPVATAGTTSSASVCANSGSYTVPSGYTAANGTILWTSNGQGTITGGSTTLTPTYTFGGTDITNGGIITLTMTVTGSSPCTPVTAQFFLTINLFPSASPGTITSNTLCGSANSYTIPSGYTATHGTISWSSSGDGTFTNNTSTTPTYIFGTHDKDTGGIVSLTMSVSDGGACPPATASFSLTIVPEPIATADTTTATICASASDYTIPSGYFTGQNGTISWTSTGDGAFTSGGNTVTPTYTLGSNDQTNGGIKTFTMTVTGSSPCTNATAQFFLIIKKLPIANPGTITSATACAVANSYNIPAGYTATNGSPGTGITWSTSGDGTFTNGTTATPKYTFGTGDRTSPVPITLTMSVGDGGVCPPATTTFTLNIKPLPVATAGATSSATICAATDSFTVPAGYSSANGTISWTSSGNGTFTTGRTTPTPTYVFGSSDLASGGLITLTMSVTDTSTCGAPAATAPFALTIDLPPTAAAGARSRDTICASALSYTIPAGYSSSNGTISWASSGDGTFTAGNTTTTPTYTFGTHDKTVGGPITLTMTVADGGVCDPAYATFALVVSPVPTVATGSQTTDSICASALSYTIPAGYSSTNGNVQWSSSGDGTFANGNTLTPTYNFGTNDKATGGVITLTMTVADSGICASVPATFALTIFPLPIAAPGSRSTDTICTSALSYTIPAYTANYGTITWISSGDGTFTAGSTTTSPTYTFGPNDKTLGGLITLTMTVADNGLCTQATATFALTIDLLPAIIPGPQTTDSICASALSYTIPGGYSSSNGRVQWTSSGDGTFTNGTGLTPTYNFGTNDKATGGLITLTATVSDGGICAPATSTFALTIFPLPIAVPGARAADTVCTSALSYTIPAYTANYGTISWISSGDGTFTSGSTTTSPTYTFGPNDKTLGGLITLTMTVSDNGLCTQASATFALTIDLLPSATAGPITTDTLCGSALSYTIPPGYSSTNGTIQWISNGDGTFTNGNTLTPTYNFGINDVTNGGVVTLTMTVGDGGVCASSAANFALDILLSPVADPGTRTRDTVCATTLSYTVPGYTAIHGTVSWTTTGDGTFNADSTTAAPTYTFGTNDTNIGGLITLTMTVTNNGVCAASTATFGLVVSPLPAAAAGATTYDTLCASALSYTIPAGYTSAHGTIRWTSSGDGTFTNGNTLTPTYNFGTNDKAVGGTKTLTMTVGDSGICANATATFALTIYPLPIATAGLITRDTICASVLSYTISGYTAANGSINWATTGDGTFTNGTTTAPTYTFGTHDKTVGGLITLTMTVTDSGICAPGIVTFALVVSPQPAVTAGPTTYDTLCASALSYTIPAGYTSGNGTIQWSSSGDGTFTNGNTLTPTYNFGTNDKAIGGTKTLTMTVADSGICANATATFALTIYPLPIATAGSRTTDTICASLLSYTIPGYTAANGNINWTTTGDGTFTNGSTAGPTYTFGTHDKTIGGLITLTMTVTDSGICAPAIVTFALVVSPQPTASVGPTTYDTLCASVLSYAIPAGYTSANGTILWSTSGDGTFTNGTTLTPTYVFGANDKAVGGTKTLTMTIADSGICANATATFALTIYPLPIATTGPKTTDSICASALSYAIPGYSGSNGTIAWTTSGDGTFTNGTTAAPTYTFGTNDKAIGGVIMLTMTVTDGGICVPAIVRFALTIYPNPTIATVGPRQNICASLTSASLAGNTPTVGTGLWTQALGHGVTVFSNPTSGTSIATASDTGTYVYTWTISNGVCAPTSASETVAYYGTPTTATAGPTQNICNSLTSSPLGGNTPTVGSGAWAQLSGPGTTTFSNPASGSATATATAYGRYVYTWVITNGNCAASTAHDTVNYSAGQSTATVGPTQNFCGTLTSTSLGGNTPTVGTGAWTQTSGPGTTTFSNPASGTSTATASVPGTYVYTWTITNGSCTPSTASITVNYYAVPVASTIPTLNICGTLTSTPLSGNTPTVGTGLWTQTSGTSTSTFSNATSGTSTATAPAYGTYVYKWTVSNGTCPPASASETVHYNLAPAAVTFYDTLPHGGYIQIGTQTYSSTGVYVAQTTSVSGCDSVVNLHLFVDGANTNTILYDTICQGQDVSVNNIKYFTQGVYVDTLAGSQNSDSIVTLNLVVLPYTTPTVSISLSRGPIINGMQVDTLTALPTQCEDPYYTWYQNNQPISAHGQVAIVESPTGQLDSFECRVDCRKGCPSPAYALSSTIRIVSGINDLVSFIQGMSLYPNPTQGAFTVEIATADIADKEAAITVTDLMGRTVLTVPFTLHSGENKEELTLRGNASGVYIVQLTVDGQSVFSRIVLDK